MATTIALTFIFAAYRPMFYCARFVLREDGHFWGWSARNIWRKPELMSREIWFCTWSHGRAPCFEDAYGRTRPATSHSSHPVNLCERLECQTKRVILLGKGLAWNYHELGCFTWILARQHPRFEGWVGKFGCFPPPSNKLLSKTYRSPEDSNTPNVGYC